MVSTKKKMSPLVGSQASQTAWELPPTKPLDEAVWRAWVDKGRLRDRRYSIAGIKAFLISLLAFAAMSAATLDQDLSKYRNFQLGTDLPTIAKQVGADPSEARVIHSRPALIQELEWHPQPLGLSSRAEAVQKVVFSFYSGELFRIVVYYDRYETEGLTADDLIQAMSANYGTAGKPIPPAIAAQNGYEDQEEIVARWQDSEYCFDLVRSSYGPTFSLIGIQKRLEAPAQAALTEAKRLDDQEAPQREAAQVAAEKKAQQTKLEKSRIENKLKFRP
jgi:hypothetical protein